MNLFHRDKKDPGGEDSPSSSGTPPGPSLADIEQKLEQVLRRMEVLPATPASSSSAAHSAASEVSLNAILQPLAAKVDALCQQQTHLVELLERIEGQATIDAGTANDRNSVPGTAGQGDWPAALLGDELSQLRSIEGQRQKLLTGLLSGQDAARALVGQILVFQAARAEQIPQLLQDLGEAYYRWQPKGRPGASPLEKALAGWAERRCEAGGVTNRIELVDPGQRFDTTRHNSTTRGVEVDAVWGWVVLRDNGKVYTKAAVGVR